MAEAKSPRLEVPPEPESPADRRLREEGGEIIPEGFSPSGEPEKLDFDRIKPIVEEIGHGPKHAQESPTARVIEVPGGVLSSAGAPPPGIKASSKPSPEQIAFQQHLDGLVNLEVNIFNTCYGAVRNFVQYRLASEPLDSAELGQSLFGPGQRTPLEQAEPHIAIEVYKAVRQNLRETSRTTFWGLFSHLLRRIFR